MNKEAVEEVKAGEISFQAKLAYLSKEEDRVAIIIPKNVKPFIRRNVVFKVTLRQMGSV